MPDIQSVLREEIRRLARKEIRSELEATRKAVSQQRQQIAELKRRNKALERTVSDLHSHEMERMKAEPSKGESRKGTRFSVRSLKAQRRRLGLFQEAFARLVGVGKSTIHNWESGRFKPSAEHLATLVTLRGIGKREAQQRLESRKGSRRRGGKE